ncbi:MAG: hypothetical protein ABIP63_06580 [Thermoanaerobaculia bacterium]
MKKALPPPKPSRKPPAPAKKSGKSAKKAPAKLARKTAPVKPQKPAKAAKSVAPKPVKAGKTASAKSKQPAVALKAKAAGRPAATAVAKSSVKAVAAVKAAVKATAKSVVKAASAAAASVARAVAPAADDKKKRRPRARITSNGPATAAWFSQGDNKPRPSSFIPAPPRAEAPSLVAAPPASSDRLVDANELTEFAVRTVPVRVDIEAGGGKIYLGINPTEVVLHPGEGIEWDFRYLGGADIVIEELVVEFEKPAPFGGGVFRTRRPGAARPHRQLSGPVAKSALGKRIQYTIRAFNGFKTEMATVKPAVRVESSAPSSQ